MRCPSCDAELPNDARFCIECGLTLDSATTGPTVHLRPEDQAPVTCAACGASNPGHAIFCVRCGRRMGDPAPQPAPPRPAISGDVIQGAPTMPTFQRARRAAPGRSRDWEAASVAVFLIGIALLFFSKLFWPGILIVIGLSNFVRVAGRGQIGVGLRNTFWLFGLAFLFMMPRLFFPGILVLVGLSALLEAIMRGARRP
ncbi:zinc ribbon domain-containing protein [Oscillochloris sp. ZM17-4]|uniref:zinc ribbon domain-containing protein n=1 Tax=Oscillochloris sp. ZM17-4 TaxID=2866714 RepID=UPI001C73D259|nr:zinc ribbon domain-containing protein [Oscillochloris sp. ZM17-4]MBX0330582.1 zinc ribbon domain-containing protein [Oscillochloris sp. ZM17-4]